MHLVEVAMVRITKHPFRKLSTYPPPHPPSPNPLSPFQTHSLTHSICPALEFLSHFLSVKFILSLSLSSRTSLFHPLYPSHPSA